MQFDIRRTIVPFLFSLALASPAAARNVYSPSEIHVVDGDTIRIGDERIRLLGVDTPEPTRYGNAGCDEEAELGDQELIASGIGRR